MITIHNDYNNYIIIIIIIIIITIIIIFIIIIFIIFIFITGRVGADTHPEKLSHDKKRKNSEKTAKRYSFSD